CASPPTGSTPASCSTSATIWMDACTSTACNPWRRSPSCPSSSATGSRRGTDARGAVARMAGSERSADVVVIGGGLVGCALARELARRGARTVLVERAELAGEASRAAAGMVAPQAETERPGPLLPLALASRRLYPDWVTSVEAESGLDVEYREDGILYVALRAADARVLSARGAPPPPL